MSPAPLPRATTARLLSLGAAVLGAVLLSLPWRWLATAEHAAADLQFQARATAAPDSDAVIVGVSDSSLAIGERAPREVENAPVLAAMNRPWPWDRRVFAEAVRHLRRAGAKAIVVDVVFAAKNTGDAEFAAALAEPGAPVILASHWQEAAAADGDRTVTLLEPRPALLASRQVRTGYANVWPDHDGVVRHFTTRQTASDFLGPAPRQTDTGERSLAAAAAAVLGAPEVPPDGYVAWRTVPGTVPVVPIEDLFLPNSPIGAGQLFHHRVVWIGPTSEIQFKDYHLTPVGRMAGVELQARTLQTLLSGRVAHDVSRTAALLCLWVMAVVGVAIPLSSRRVTRQIALLVTAIMAWGGLVSLLFATGIVLPFIAPVSACVLAGGAGVTAHFVVEQRERRRLRGMLDRYVSKEIARVIVEQPEDFSRSLRGQRRATTVLFADLRGFTSWAETAEPEIFVAQLNEYFHAIVDCVLAQGGTLQKFIGDAVLAVWGDTRSDGPAEDATRGLDAALAMQAAVAKLNTKWAGRPDRRPIAIGIGLHHGVAMVGNVGHPQRMEFTVLGDVVNTASRLESATRQYGTSLLVSAAVEALTRQTHAFVPLGRVALQGKREPIALYTAIGRNAIGCAWLPDAVSAEAALTVGDFRHATELYSVLTARAPELADCFHRLATFATRASADRPADWNGVRILDKK